MDNEVLINFIRDDKKSFKVGSTQPWRFLKGKGIQNFTEFTGSLSQVENYSTDGGRIENVRLSLVDRTVGLAYINPANNETAREAFKAFFMYGRKYDVHVTYMGVTRWARGELYKMKMSDKTDLTLLQTATMTFRFENPYWLSEDDYGQDIASMTPMAGFPHISSMVWGMTAGKFNFDQEVDIINDADVPTYPVIVINSKGEVVNPSITINNAVVKLSDTLENGDRVVMDFESVPPTIKKNGVNALGLCDRTSNFDDMYFNVGDNSISYGADNGSDNMSVSVKFYKKYTLI